MMFQNNNGKAIKQIANKSFKANKSRNLFVIVALILTTFMITSVFSMGFSYTKTNEVQQLRMMGTTAHTAITNINEEQIEQIRQAAFEDSDSNNSVGAMTTLKEADAKGNSSKDSFIFAIGLNHRLGSVEGDDNNDALLGLLWIDETEWKIHKLPTVTGVKGKYPNAENELMLPTWALAKMGIDNPMIGMEISIGYRLVSDNELQNKTFILSGYYTEYMQTRTGNKGAAYVSESFRNASGIPLSNGGTAMLTFDDSKNISAYCELLKSRIDISENQSFKTVPLYEKSDNSMVIVLGGVIGVIIAAGYLLIYNILYISVSKDIRSYGQLKTLGTTKRQIKKLIYLQVVKVCAIGIPVGLILGAVVSFGIVPLFLNVFSTGDVSLGYSVSFSPFIFMLAAVFSFLTVIAASLKPMKIAASISPVEAVKFTGVKNSKIKQQNSRRGARIPHMAWRNIFRNRKSAALVFSSLFFGLLLFLLSTGLLGSLSPQNFVNQFLQSDISITLGITSKNKVLTEKMVSDIREIEGVKSVNTSFTSAPYVEIPVTYTKETFGKYIDSLADNPEIKSDIDFSDPEVIKGYLEYFASYVFGIDSVYAKELKASELESFEKGETILLKRQLDTEGNNLFEIGQEIELVSEQTGRKTYKIGGFLREDFQSGTDRGAAPSIFMSKEALKRISPDNKIGRIDIETDRRNDAAILAEIKNITGNSSELLTKSRYEKENEIRDYITACKVMGTGLSIILLLIGVVNFINTMLVSVTTRRQELAVLESIGMTARQIRKMLVLEGIYYFFITFALTGTIGTVLLAAGFRVLKSAADYAVFTYPVVPLAAAASFLIIVCAVIPLATYWSNRRHSVVERLRIM